MNTYADVRQINEDEAVLYLPDTNELISVPRGNESPIEWYGRWVIGSVVSISEPREARVIEADGVMREIRPYRARPIAVDLSSSGQLEVCSS